MVVAEILDQGVELVVGNYDAQLAVALLFKGGGGNSPAIFSCRLAIYSVYYGAKCFNDK